MSTLFDQRSLVPKCTEGVPERVVLLKLWYVKTRKMDNELAIRYAGKSPVTNIHHLARVISLEKRATLVGTCNPHRNDIVFPYNMRRVFSIKLGLNCWQAITKTREIIFPGWLPPIERRHQVILKWLLVTTLTGRISEGGLPAIRLFEFALQMAPLEGTMDKITGRRAELGATKGDEIRGSFNIT
jgi:hypothetical protein